MSDELSARLIVMDTGPLITLAAADSLDYLLYPGIPLYVPDAVLFEATRDSEALGAAEILAWAQRNGDRVRTISTQVFFSYVANLAAGGARRERDLGERSAIEAIHDGFQLAADERAILMTEDDRVLRRILIFESELTTRMIPVTTRDFLTGMEAAGRINSAEEVYRRAEDSGRLASRRATLADQDERAREAVNRLIRSS